VADTKISSLSATTTPLAGTEVLPVVQSGATKKVSVDNLTVGRTVGANAFQGNGAAWTGTNGNVQTTNPPSSTGVWIGWNKSGGFAEGNLVYGGNYFEIGKWNGTTYSPQVYLDSSNNLQIVSGNLALNTAAKGVNFTANTPAAGMTSQLLNWYEEGTWTPVVQFGGANTGMTVTASGRYTRVGRIVTISVNIAFTAKGSSTGNFRFDLPFNAGAKASGSMGFNFSWATMPTGGITFMADGGYVYGMPANIGGYIDDTYLNNGTTIEAITISYTV
jgi:hypothetical protein